MAFPANAHYFPAVPLLHTSKKGGGTEHLSLAEIREIKGGKSRKAVVCRRGNGARVGRKAEGVG